MFCVFCELCLIGLGILNEFAYPATKYSSKKSRYVPYLVNLLVILLLIYFACKEEKTVNQIVYLSGSFMLLFQLIDQIRNNVRYKSCVRLVSLKRFLLFVLCDEEIGEEYIKKTNMIFEVLNEVDSYGTIFLLRDSKEKTIKILMLIKHAVQVSKIKEVCDMLGEYEFCGENENRKRCAIMLKMK